MLAWFGELRIGEILWHLGMSSTAAATGVNGNVLLAVSGFLYANATYVV